MSWSRRAASTPICTKAGSASPPPTPPRAVSRPAEGAQCPERGYGPQNARSALDLRPVLVDCLSVDRRMVPGAVVGAVGLLLGVIGLVVEVPVLGLLAGVFALGGGLLAVVETRRVQEAETEAASAV